MEGNEIKNAAGTLLDMILHQGSEREENTGKAARKASRKAAEKPIDRLKNKAPKPVKDLVKKAEKAFEKPLNKAKKALKNKAVDAKKEAANKADEAVTRSTEKAAQAMGDAAAPVTFGVSAAAGKGAAVMQEAGLQARKTGREVTAKAEKGMTDSVADKIAQYSKSSGMALISGDLPGIGAKEAAR